MMLPVFIHDWQIGDGDIAPPFVGMTLSHVLIFRTAGDEPARTHGLSGREVTVTGVAKHLADSESHQLGAFPTSITCNDFVLYWDAPAVTEGPVTLTGVVAADDYGTSPEGFPEVAGVVESMALVSVLLIREHAGSVNWIPAPGTRESFRPVGSYPPHAAAPAGRTSPHTEVSGVVVALNTSAGVVAAARAAPQAAAAEGTPVRVRMFPDYADTVVWLPGHGPVNYDDAHLSPGLTADLMAWEASYYASLTPELDWRSASRAADFTAAGQDLAQRLAKELGENFTVEFHSYAGKSSKELFRSSDRAKNPAAVEAFTAFVAAEAALLAKFAADTTNGVGWFAYAPMSGTVFQPGPDSRA
ncbi:hypothetical protein ACX80E_01715 [Arthrobacter sp. TMN-49]